MVGNGRLCSPINPLHKLDSFFFFCIACPLTLYLKVETKSQTETAQKARKYTCSTCFYAPCTEIKHFRPISTNLTFAKLTSKVWRKTSLTGFAKSLWAGHNVLVAASVQRTKTEQCHSNAASKEKGTAEVTVQSSWHLEQMRVFLQTNKCKCRNCSTPFMMAWWKMLYRAVVYASRKWEQRNSESLAPTKHLHSSWQVPWLLFDPEVHHRIFMKIGSVSSHQLSWRVELYFTTLRTTDLLLSNALLGSFRFEYSNGLLLLVCRQLLHRKAWTTSLCWPWTFLESSIKKKSQPFFHRR